MFGSGEECSIIHKILRHTLRTDQVIAYGRVQKGLQALCEVWIVHVFLALGDALACLL